MDHLSRADIWMIAPTIAIAIFNGLLFFFTYRLWVHAVEQSEKQSELTIASNSISAAAARAAEQSAMALSSSVELELRPYVFPVVYDGLAARQDDVIRIAFKLQNVGRSPAHSLSVKSLHEVFDLKTERPANLVAKLASLPTTPHVALAPGEVFYHRVIGRLTLPSTDLADKHVCAVCEIAYSDVFGKSHVSRMGATLTLDPNSIRQTWDVAPFISHFT